MSHGLFGDPPSRLVDPPLGAVQFSPLVPGAAALETAAAGSLGGMTMLAAPGTLERRYDLAAMLRALAPGSPFTILAPKDMGGSRIGRELAGLGCTFDESAKAHHRICTGSRPTELADAALREAIEGGAPRRLDALGLWSQPGIFSWDRVDPGTALLLDALPSLAGRGADLGCGIGLLAHAVLASAGVTRLDLIDVDRRAIEATRRNVDDPRVRVTWADLRTDAKAAALENLDFVVMNPPFHDAGSEDKSLGQLFIRRAAEMLRKGGRLWLVANRHLPYEAVLAPLFRTVTPQLDAQGFKVIGGGEMTTARPGAVRLDKLLANLGYGSRREIAAMARAGRITLDGRALTSADDKIAMDVAAGLMVAGMPVDPLPGLVLMVNKPIGTTCSHKEAGPLVYDLLPERWRRREPPLSSVGRLDKETSGLLLVTDDGALLHRIIAPKSHVPKRYRATLARPLRGDESDIFSAGTLMLDGETKPLLPAKLEVLRPTEVAVTIEEGRYHQVRRMLAAVGNHVETLHREAMGGLELPVNLEAGAYRVLDAAAVAAIFAVPALI